MDFHSGIDRTADCDVGLQVAIWHGVRRGASHSRCGRERRAAGSGPVQGPSQQYSPNVGQTFPNRVLWGLTHIHTSLSADAGLMGITLGPDQLFRSAMGQEVTTTTGLKFKLERPLDWLAITDHAEYLGISGQLATGNPELLANPTGKKWYELYKGNAQQRMRGRLGCFRVHRGGQGPHQ